MKKFSRRDFLKNAAVGAVGIATAGVLSGLVTAVKKQPGFIDQAPILLLTRAWEL